MKCYFCNTECIISDDSRLFVHKCDRHDISNHQILIKYFGHWESYKANSCLIALSVNFKNSIVYNLYPNGDFVLNKSQERYKRILSGNISCVSREQILKTCVKNLIYDNFQ